MRTNPNIILSGNQMAQPRLPDVNAMMQTRTAGLENIYNTEQQRAEQQRAAQKEQEAAAVEAMLPSVVAAYSDPSDAGLDQAVALMPAEVRDTFAPFVSRLKTVRDPAARKAIIEAELAKDEAGRAVLDRVPTEIQRMNADIQRGQLEVSRANAAREAAAANQPPQVSPDKAAELEYRREKDAADRAAKAAMPEGGGVKPEAAAKADDTLGKIMAAYDKLRDLKAITSTNQTAVENLKATASAKTGSTLGAAVGSEAQTQRQIIKNLRQALLNDIKAATGMSSKAIDSNVELQSFLNSLGDPENQSYEAAIATIGELSAKYAGGALSGRAQDVLKGKTDLQPPPAGTATGRIPQISSDEEYDMLPSGAVYIDPNGQQRTKR
jgi:hypothetical protein